MSGTGVARKFAFTGARLIVARMNFLSRLAALAATLVFALTFVRAAEDGPHASKPEVRREIVAVIDAQLSAFRTGDMPKAYSYASAALRAQKPIRAFLAIVQDNYPEIWASTRAEFGLVRDDGTTATLLVHVFGKDSDAAYDYTLTKDPAGWRIAAVLRHAPKKSDRM
jgi:hypothetical protein